jgi:hypothetical protein
MPRSWQAEEAMGKEVETFKSAFTSLATLLAEATKQDMDPQLLV